MIEGLFDDLNPEQRRAVEALDGPLCVVAGAGSGKTRVITRRVAHLVARGTPPESILGVTFTNKAAREMRERVFELTGRSCPTLATFHGFCAATLREHAPSIGRRGDFTIFDEADARATMKAAVEELNLDPEQHPPSVLIEHRSALRNARPGEAPEWPGRPAASVLEGVAAALVRYGELLVAANAMDFDDLLVETARLCDESPEALELLRARFTHVMVDEFQDTNPTQYRIVRALAARGRNLCVTGDPDQSIYSWRGADPRNFEDFRADFPEAEEVVLAQNYRSTNAILRAASELMRPAPDRTPKTLWSELGEGEPVSVVRFGSERDESEAIAECVGAWEREGFPRTSQAVLFRTNALTLPLERALLARGVPYRVLGGLEFYGRAEVKDVLAYLRALVNPRDALAFRRILNTPTRGLGDKAEAAILDEARRRGLAPLECLLSGGRPAGLTRRAADALEAFAALMARLSALPHDRPAAVVDAVLEETSYAERLAARPAKGRSQDPLRNLDQLRALAREFEEDLGGTLPQFLEHAALTGGRDRGEGAADPVTLLTIHAAKGLEFDSVIVVACEEEILPHAAVLREPGGLEEERRLLHVAMTRARRRLVLTVCARRTKFGREQAAVPSRFLRDLGTAGVEFLGGGAAADAGFDPRREVEEDDVDADDERLRLRSGSRVRHPDYGEGEVVGVRGRGKGLDAVVVVRFDGGDVRSLLLRYAKLAALDVEF